MSALVSAASTVAFQGLEVGEIVGNLEKLGFSGRITNKVLKDLMAARLCFSRSHQEFNPDSVLVPTRLCGYIVRDLVAKMVFLENVLFDTFIYDDQVWSMIRGLAKDIYAESRPVEKFKLRKAMTKAFFDWTDGEMTKLSVSAANRNLGPFWTSNPISRMRVDFEAELERAFRSAVRNYGSDKERELLGLPIGPAGESKAYRAVP
jgi:hypothetical protein